MYNGRSAGPRGPYKTFTETRGKAGKETKAISSFWKKHKMDDMITKTPEELDEVIETWILQYQETQVSRNRNWWYPESSSNYRKTVDKNKSK